TVDDVKAEQLLLGLCKRPVDDQRRLMVLPDRRGGGRRHEADRRTELAILGKLLMDHIELGHDRFILFLAPGKDDVFVVVAEDGVEHGVSPVPKDERRLRQPTRRRPKNCRQKTAGHCGSRNLQVLRRWSPRSVKRFSSALFKS